MICPGIAVDCDNPGCRHGGCQGRPPRRLQVTAATLQVLASKAADARLPAIGIPTAAAQQARAAPELV
jgi:hypothetical protein